jgi:hypothetical protein
MWIGLIVALASSTVGCGKKADPKGPQTVAGKGKVVFTKGGNVKSLFDKQAAIVFESVEQSGVKAMGPIQEDGSFEVATVTDQGGSPGLISGTHRVRLELDDAAAKLVAPQFLDAAKSGVTVKVPSDAPLEVKIWK